MDIVATMSCDDEDVVQKKDRGSICSPTYGSVVDAFQCLKTDGIPVAATNDR